MNHRRLVQFLRVHFRLEWRDIHGAPHWARVRQNGLRLAAATGANPRVVECFAWLHDSCRRNEYHDADHGARAGELAVEVNDRLLHLKLDELRLLVAACEGHSSGRPGGNPTVQTCWDADRLDLGRVGIRPDPRRLCTPAAREPSVIDWAYARSISRSR
jgi:uncharacterized protein